MCDCTLEVDHVVADTNASYAESFTMICIAAGVFENALAFARVGTPYGPLLNVIDPVYDTTVDEPEAPDMSTVGWDVVKSDIGNTIAVPWDTRFQEEP